MVGGTCYTVNLWSAAPAIGNRSVLAGTPESRGGAIAYFGTTDAGSQSELPFFRSAVYRGLFSGAFDERAYRLGPATLIARDSVFSMWDWRPRYLEWNLLGDPTLSMWVGGVPKPAVLADLPDDHRLFVGYDQPLGVTAISTAGGALVGALVCAYKPGEVLVTGRTDSTGHAVLVVHPTTAGPLYLTVSEGHAQGESGAVGIPMLPCFDTLDCIDYVPWTERRHMPPDPSYKAASSGGWLTYDVGDGQVYSAKGHGVADFYRYDPNQDSWHQLWDIQLGGEGKLPKKGCRGASDGDGSVYMVKGNNSVGFWRYDVAGNEWHQLPDVPRGLRLSRVKRGTDMVHVTGDGGGYLYLLKGKGTEFWRYRVADSSWEAEPDAPAGRRARWDEGSWLVYDGAQSIYALKAKYHEFWKFDVEGETWYSQPLASMPFGSAGKKVKDGGSACYRNDLIFALKGGNTQEFWVYDPVKDEWEQRDTIPSRDSSGLRKRVKGGGDIVLAGDEILALKGNNTRALWQYWPAPNKGAFDQMAGRFIYTGPRRPGSGSTDGGETGLAEGMEAITPRWNAQGTAVCYVREAEDGVGAGYDQVFMVRASEPGTEVRLVDIAMDCSDPVFHPSGSHICFVLDDTVTERLQIATVPVPDADLAREQQEKTEERAVTNDDAGRCDGCGSRHRLAPGQPQSGPRPGLSVLAGGHAGRRRLGQGLRCRGQTGQRPVLGQGSGWSERGGLDRPGPERQVGSGGCVFLHARDA